MMTPVEVEERFEEAASTLRRLPSVLGPTAYSNNWPQILRDAREADDAGTDHRPMRVPPTAAAITRMEECFTWLSWLEPEDARIVWLRAAGVRWKPICWRIGISRPTAWRRWAAALIVVSTRLKTSSKPLSKKPIVKAQPQTPAKPVVNT